MLPKFSIDFFLFRAKNTIDKTLTEFLRVIKRTGRNFPAYMAFITDVIHTRLVKRRKVIPTLYRSLLVPVAPLPFVSNKAAARFHDA